MKDQVKPGDLAVIVGGNCPENYGAVVRVLWGLPAGSDLTVPDVTGWPCTFSPVHVPAFMVESQGRMLVAHPIGNCFVQRPYHASCLRPLRDTDGEDEMLRIAGKPQSTPLDFVDTGFVPLEK